MPGYIIVAGVTGAGSLAEGALPEPADEQRQKAVEYVAELDRPPVDVQAAVTVLGRLPTRSGLTVDVGANLTGARLEQANLTGAIYLVQGQVDVAFGDKDTLLPAGLRRPELWSRG